MSSRCMFKNTRHFFEGKSLLDICVNQIDESKHEVFLACTASDTSTNRANFLKVNRLVLSKESLTNNWGEICVEIAHSFPNDEEIAFLLCTNPLYFKFNDVNEHLNNANSMTVYPFKHYMLDENMRGVNFGQGSWHVPSQKLPLWHINPWILSVTSPKSVVKCQYWHTPDVKPILANGPFLDIDTEEEFQLAQKMYKFL